MKKQKQRQYIVLGILFFLPVIFLLFLYPAKHNYVPLDVVKTQVKDITDFSSNDKDVKLLDHITVVGFLGNKPIENSIAASNVKELIYDKFKGFKKFQIVMILPLGSENEAKKLRDEISYYEDLKYWHFIFANENKIIDFYESLREDKPLNRDLSTPQIFIIDKELNQRGRLDDRNDKEIENNKPQVSLLSYNTIEVAEIKNKFGEDLRILFTEYRQKRKGNFDSTQRRKNDINPTNE